MEGVGELRARSDKGGGVHEIRQGNRAKGGGLRSAFTGGMSDGKLEIPSWVPVSFVCFSSLSTFGELILPQDWSDEVCPSSAAAEKVPSQTTSIQLGSDNRLLIPGKLADEIETLSDHPFVSPGAPTSPDMKEGDFDDALWQASLQVFWSPIADQLLAAG
jgi:hypothetical protein